MRAIGSALVAAWVCACLGAISFADEPAAAADKARSFDLPQHGALILQTPGAWKEEVRQPPGELPPTIILTPEQGDEFNVLITPLWSPRKDPDFNTSDKIKALIDNDLKQMLPSAVEKEVALQDFKTVDGSGYYFFVTDKAPRPGEYPYAVRAGAGVGDLLLSVTVLCRSKDSPAIAATIKALESATQAEK